MMRVMLYEAAQSMMRSKKWSWLKAWAMQIARRRGMKKAIVALARRLAVIMHRIWVERHDLADFGRRAIDGPCVHQLLPLVEQVTAPVSRLRLVLDHMG